MGKDDTFRAGRPFWRILDRLTDTVYLLSAHGQAGVRYAPLYYHKFKLCIPHKVLEAHKFKLQYQGIAQIGSFSDRLRWCRHQLGLTQKEVADRLGVSRSTYLDLEIGAVDYCSREQADKLSALFGVPVENLLDEYNCFLYRGQGETIRGYRRQLNMGRRTFARFIHVSDNSIRQWEAESVRVSRKSWEKYFKSFRC